MRVLTSVPAGHERGIVWQTPDGQQVLAPSIVHLELIEPAPDLSPFPVTITAALVDGRYEVTRLVLRADVHADDPVDTIRHNSDVMATRIALGVRSDHLPAITARGLAAVRLPAILREGLDGQARVRFRNAFGEWTEGVVPGDEVAVEYVIARAVGLDPTTHVAGRLGISQGAAAQRVKRLRDAGRIPPADRKGAR